MSKFLLQFQAARRAGTPLLAIQTPDPAATINTIKTTSGTQIAVIVWDCINGWNNQPDGAMTNDAGLLAITTIFGDADVASATRIPAEMLDAARALPPDAMLVMLNAQRLFDQNDSAGQAQAVQGLWNLRDPFKSTGRTVILLSPSFRLPSELSQDIFILDEPLPVDVELAEIIKSVYASAEMEASQDVIDKAVDATRGLAAFPAEQVLAMSLKRDGLDLQEVWERKRQMIEATPGLAVWRGGEQFNDIGGCEQVKFFLKKVISGKRPPKTVIWLDEIEKALGGQGDTTGISQDYLGTVLSFMQDNEASGVIFLGVAGAAKSALAKATGAEANVPTIRLDLNGMKGSLVGESERRLREALKVVKAVGDGGMFFIATCNKIEALPPELRRRFELGLFFFDLPTTEERALIWQTYQTKYAVPDTRPIDFDTDWTGAEIKTCCRLASDLEMSLADAAQFIVPVAKASPDSVLALRKQAHGKFLSASYPGVYKFQEQPASVVAQGRKLTVQ